MSAHSGQIRSLLGVGRCAGWLLAFPLLAESQTLRGTVVHRDSVTPAAGLMVEVQTTNAGAFRTLTDSRGLFALRVPGPDSLRVRVLRIGFAPTVMPATYFGGDGSAPLRIVLADTRYYLSGVTVVGDSRCGKRSDQEAFLLWEQARMALSAVVLAEDDTSLRFRIVEYDGETTIDGVTRIRSDSVLRLVTARLPASDAYYDSLFQRGYVRRNLPDSAMTYYAPDARVLVDERFTPRYCFRMAAADSEAQGIGVAFAPVERRSSTDIEGTLWLDRASLELQRMDFEFVQLPRDHNVRGPGGYVQFAKLPTGHWIMSEWMLRMAQPVHALDKCGNNWRGVPIVVPVKTEKGGCGHVVSHKTILWGRSQTVASVMKGDLRLFFEEYAESLARRAEGVKRPRD